MGPVSKSELGKNLIKRFIWDESGMSSVELAVMFGVVAVGFSLLAAPLLEKTGKRLARNDGFMGQEIDNVVTGSISKSQRYTIRRSVLQPNKTSQCLILQDGRKFGDC